MALLQQRSQATTEIVSMESLNIDEHLKVLREECRKTAAGILGIFNPVARFKFENLMDSALTQISSGLGSSDGMSHTTAMSEKSLVAEGTTKKPRRYSEIHHRTWTTYLFSISSPFGRLHPVSRALEPLGSNSAREESRHCFLQSMKTTLTFHPSQWLLSSGVNFGIQVLLSKSIQGLDCRLKSYRAVADNSLVFGCVK
ncbi:hypothetical protein DL95DRAFT_517174 [Leptodontidium sp. 2 PMI_412]|nr:hypothetical protein DL95DRAFT_517174 [Leptodontidium sp. 2 PMI_412]